MFGSEAEVQARRKTLALLQDEMRCVLDGGRDLIAAYHSMVGNDKDGLEEAVQRIRRAEENVETLRRMLTRELAEVGNLMMNREDFLRSAFDIEDIIGFISGIAFRFSYIKAKALKEAKLEEGIGNLLDMAIEAVRRTSEMVRALTINPSTALEMATSVQKMERQIDEMYREIVAKVVREVRDFRDLIVAKDIVESIEDLADRCLAATDSLTAVALTF